jgi:hypothetical protein
MALASADKSWHEIVRSAAFAAASVMGATAMAASVATAPVMAGSVLAVALMQAPARAADVLEEAINYVFTGTIAPENGPSLVDRKSCVVVVPDPRNKRYVRYYMSRFRMDDSRISKTYSGRQTNYTLEVDGDDTIIEYLDLDRKTVVIGYKTAQIPLPGNIDQTEKALHLIFTQYCKTDAPKAPF